MNARDRNRRTSAVSDREAALDQEIQQYVDGTLDHKAALRMHLRARVDSHLTGKIAVTRDLFESLDALPRAQPSAGFDSRILASIPLERYRSAPRRRVPFLVIGDLAPAAWLLALQRAGRGAIAAAVAYLLVLMVANSALQSGVSALAASMDRRIATAVERTESVAVVSTLVSALAWVYDSAATAVGFLAGAVGPGALIIGFGMLLGMGVLASLSSRQRRHLGNSTH